MGVHAPSSGQYLRPGPGPAGSIASSYRGTWVSGTAYAINDVVVWNGTSYVAVKASQGSQPDQPGMIQVGAVTQAANNNYASSTAGIQQPFTLTAQTTIMGFQLLARGGTIPAGTTFQLTSAANTNPTVYATGNVTTTAADGTYATVQFSTPYTAVAGSYAFTIPNNTGFPATTGTPATTSGVITVPTNMTYGTANSYTNTFSAAFIFRLMGADTVWSVLASVGAAGSIAASYKSAWAAGTYAKNDVVTRSGGSYLSLQDANTDDPTTPAPLGTSLAAYNSSSPTNNISAGGSMAQKITPNAAFSPYGCRIAFQVAPGAGTMTVGIASAVGASITWLGKGTVTTTAGTAAGATADVAFDVMPQLNSGTVYYLVVQGTSALVDAVKLTTYSSLAIAGSLGNGPDGNIGGNLLYGSTLGSTTTSFRMLFDLRNAGTAKWTPLATPGAAGAAGSAGAAGAPGAPAPGALGPGPKSSFADNFNRPDGTLGNGWTSTGSGPDIKIVSNAIGPSAFSGPTGTGGSPKALAWQDFGAADGSITVTVRGTVPSSSFDAGILFRYDTTAQKFMNLKLYSNSVFIQDYWAAGSVQVGPSYSRPSGQWQDGDIFRVDFVGSNVKVYYNGVLVISVTTATNGLSATKHGVYFYGLLTDRIDDFVYTPWWGRVSVSKTTASLNAAAQETGTIQLASGYRLYSISTSSPARVRLYTTTANRDADVGRLVSTPPNQGSGVIVDYLTSVSFSGGPLSPLADGYDGKATPDGLIPYTIDNVGSTPQAITVTLTYLRTE